MRAPITTATVLQTIEAGDCVAIVFPNGWRKVAKVESTMASSITCWGFSFTFPDYTWVDCYTGETLRLDTASPDERHEYWRLVARSRLAQFDWEASDQLTDLQLRRILDILDEGPAE